MTAAQRVLARLMASEGQWVAGRELFGPDVGGIRYTARIFDLRRDGWVIEKRPDPRSSVPQWRLVPQDRQLTLEDVA